MKALQDALRALEKEAAEPVVPGELDPWCRALEARMESLVEAWEADQREQAEMARQVVEEDPALAPRVEQSREDAQALLERLEKLRGRNRDLRREDQENPTGSEESLEAVEAFRKQLLDWVVSVRAFRAELRMWLVEATHRDRGVAD